MSGDAVLYDGNTVFYSGFAVLCHGFVRGGGSGCAAGGREIPNKQLVNAIGMGCVAYPVTSTIRITPQE